MGAYSLETLVDKVKNKELTQDEFFNITRKNY
jgi:hypothetical protein